MRMDDHRRRMLVETAREMVYVDGVRPGADAISNLLASRSLTVTRVSKRFDLLIYLFPYSDSLFRTPFRTDLNNMDSIFIHYLLSISCMSLNSVYGRQYLLTFFEFYMLKEATALWSSTKGI
jgi:hypothetical protein